MVLDLHYVLSKAYLSNAERTIHEVDTCFKLEKEIREKSKLKVALPCLHLSREENTFFYLRA